MKMVLVLSAENRVIMSSEQYSLITLLKKLFPVEGLVYECIGSLKSIDNYVVTALGVWRREDRLFVKVYPGTRLYVVASNAIYSCLSPITSYEELLKTLNGSMELNNASILPLKCPKSVIAIEAVVTNRVREWHQDLSVLVLELQPVIIRVHDIPPSYTRALGLVVEIMIELTRVIYFSRIRSCEVALNHYSRLLKLLEYASEGLMKLKLWDNIKSYVVNKLNNVLRFGCLDLTTPNFL